MTSTLGRLLKLEKEDLRRLTLCGMAAGFSMVSGAPIAGAIFATEALVLGSLNYTYLLPSLITSVTSVYAARLFDQRFELHIYHPLWDIVERASCGRTSRNLLPVPCLCCFLPYSALS